MCGDLMVCYPRFLGWPVCLRRVRLRRDEQMSCSENRGESEGREDVYLVGFCGGAG